MAKQKESPKQSLEATLLQNPNDIKTRFQLAKLFFEENSLKPALMHANIILKDRPNHKNAQQLKIAIKKAQAPAQPEEKIEKLPMSSGEAAAADDSEADDDETNVMSAGAAAADDGEADVMGDWEMLEATGFH